MAGKLGTQRIGTPPYVEARRAYQQNWYLLHQEELKARAKARYHANRDEINANNKRRSRLRGVKEYIAPEHGIPRNDHRYYPEVQATAALRRRIRALQKVSGKARPVCERCGQSDWRVLEINHLNGGGGKELRRAGFVGMAELIINGHRPTDDLNVLCCSCNRLYEYDRGNRCLPRDWEAIVEQEVQRGLL